MRVFRVIDKLFLALFTFPPAYFVYRFFRWYLNTEPVEIEREIKRGDESSEESDS